MLKEQGERNSKIDLAQERRFKMSRELRGASISQIEDLVDGVVTRVKKSGTNTSLVATYKKFAEEFPQKLRLQTHKTVLDAINSSDTSVRKKGIKSFILLNAKTTLSAVEPYFTKNTSDNEDLIQIAQEDLIDNIDKVKLTQKDDEKCNVSLQIHNIITEGKILDHIAARDHLPKQAIRTKKHGIIQSQADTLMRKYPFGLDKNKLQSAATEIALQTRSHVGDIEDYLNYRDLTDHAESTSSDPSIIFEIEEKKLRDKALKQSVDRATMSLQPNEAEIIEGRYRSKDPRRVLEETTNLKKDMLIKVETKALNKLRHPSRRHLLRPFIEE